MKRPITTCPCCGRQVALRRDLSITLHQNLGAPCPGSGQIVMFFVKETAK